MAYRGLVGTGRVAGGSATRRSEGQADKNWYQHWYRYLKSGERRYDGVGAWGHKRGGSGGRVVVRKRLMEPRGRGEWNRRHEGR